MFECRCRTTANTSHLPRHLHDFSLYSIEFIQLSGPFNKNSLRVQYGFSWNQSAFYDYKDSNQYANALNWVLTMYNGTI